MPAASSAPLHDTALVLVDLQNDYFLGGAFPLPGSEAALGNARTLLEAWRRHDLPVVHIRHETLRPGAAFFLPASPGAAIHPLVAPQGDETVLLKHFPNSFRDTALQAHLDALGIRRLVVAGMMTNMCVDATVRAAFDLGYAVTVPSDACAAADLAFEDQPIAAPQVHGAFLAALASVYAAVVPTATLLAGLEANS